MKLLISLFFMTVLAFGTYKVTFALTNKKNKKIDKTKAIGVTIVVCMLLFGLLASAIYRDAKAPDIQCGKVHTTTSQLPTSLKTAMDYYEQGNYDYESGNCEKAIADYTQSIQLDPKYPQAYNNRGYTYMRLRDYKAALPDLDKALALKPDYIQALMNRGDIHNYYYAIDRQSAIKDYEKVIVLGGKEETSVCGHIFLARNNGWTLSTFLSIPKTLLMGKCN